MKRGISSRLLWAVFLFIFAIPINSGASGSNSSAGPTGQITLLEGVVSSSDPGTANGMLQFKSGGHVLGFQPTRAYLAGLDHALSVEFLGTSGVMPKADATAQVTGNITKTPTLGRIVYRNLWQGISLTYESTQDGITESTYHVEPGADVAKIRLRYNVPVEAQKDGSLKFTFASGYLTESQPVAWQEIGGKRVPVKVAFKVSGHEVGFNAGNYDPDHPLIIDPTYAWHTFYGGSGSDFCNGIAVDAGGNIYVTGYSEATWGSPLNAYSGSYDIFVLKLDSSGAYQWHTFYGGTGADLGSGIAVDAGGNIYVTGYSEATWGSPLHAHSGNYDIFVLKLDSSGTYQWHTFYGGSNYDLGSGIAVDAGGNIYVTGYSEATWGSPLHAHSGNKDIFVLKLDSSGTYQWHTFYGGTGDDLGNGIAVDAGGNVYVTGYSEATWGSPLHAHSGNKDIFVLKLDSSGTYQWHTFYGGNGDNSGNAITVDAGGNVYVTGYSEATWGSPLNAHSGNYDIFVLKLDSSGTYQWHTFYGGSSYDLGNGIAVDAGGNIYVAGQSDATWGSPLHAYSGGYDMLVLKLNSSGAYQWHTFYGGGSTDSGHGISIDGSGGIYVAGQSYATWGSPLHAYSGGYDILVLKMDEPTIYADFAGAGIWKWDGSAWSQIGTGDPVNMVVSGSQLYTSYSGQGLWQWNGGSWTKIGTGDPANMVVSGSQLYASYTGQGLWQWNGSSWSQIGPGDPAKMVVSGSQLYASYTGQGLWQWNGSSWSQIGPGNPANMVVSGSQLYASYTGQGLWNWNGSSWSQIGTGDPANMVVSGSQLYSSYTGQGLWQWNSSSWSQIGTGNPANMVVSGSQLYASYTGQGLWQWNGSSWSQIGTGDPANMVVSGSQLYASYTGQGLWQWNGGSWTKIGTGDPAKMVAGF